VKDNPRKPWKAVAGAVVALATYLVTDQALNLPPWLVAVLTLVATYGGVYVKRNPKVRQ